MHIRQIIEYTSDGQQQFESFLRLHVRMCVQGVIEAMSSSSASGCASALVDLRQQLVKKTEWIFGWMGHSIVDEAFEEFLRDHPDLRNAVKAQVSVLCESVIQVIHDGNITRHRQTNEDRRVVIVVVLHK